VTKIAVRWALCNGLAKTAARRRSGRQRARAKKTAFGKWTVRPAKNTAAGGRFHSQALVPLARDRRNASHRSDQTIRSYHCSDLSVRIWSTAEPFLRSSQKDLVAGRLPEECERPACTAAPAYVDRPDLKKNDGKSSMTASWAALQFQATHSRESAIEGQTINYGRKVRPETPPPPIRNSLCSYQML
jgi:hypothetical protein